MYIEVMTTRQRKIAPVLALLVIALAGLMLLQAYLINNAYLLKEQAFRQNVGAALSAAALRLKAGETLSRAMRYDFRSKAGGKHEEEASSGFPVNVNGNGTSLTYSVGSPQRVRVRMFNNAGCDTLVMDSLQQPGTHSLGIDTALTKMGGYAYRVTTDSTTMVVNVGAGTQRTGFTGLTTDKDRFFVVSAVYDDLFPEGRVSGKNISPALLDSVLKGSMRDAGIPLPFAYGILPPAGDSVIMATPASAAGELRSAEFRTPLFHLPLAPPGGDLAVVFTGRKAYLLGELWPVLAASVFFIVIIALCFASAVRTIARQERLAGHMVDFINNMTHEFKTPISTVGLASEAIGRPDVLGDTAKVSKYNGMIADETLRMKKQVDRILEMAVIEEGDYDLALSDVDMHEVIRSAVGNAALNVEARGGSIACALGAEHHALRGDAVHLSNVVHNLLDNASKYSPGAPAISVSTANESGALVVRVSDRGIGIPPEHISRVFDRYYRVPTGNLHDVKGFGLGLRYVRLLVEAHGGVVTLKSRQGEGTEVSMRFPGGPAR